MKFIVLLLSFSIVQVYSQTQPKEAFQTEIEKAFVNCIEKDSPQALEKMANMLLRAFNEKDTIPTRYWLSYARYHQALFASEIQQDKKEAESFIDKAISLLEPLKKDSESLALLSLQTGYSIRFKGYFAMIGLGQDSRTFAETALKRNPNNLRAYYALALNNFYTPKVFGGGTEVEDILKKALALTKNTLKKINPAGEETVSMNF
jgi:tetratricopeptide (TPR) repeat protein